MLIIEEYNRLGADLERLLVLRTSPLAIKLLEKEEDVPEGAIRPKKERGYHLALCQAFAMSRRERVAVAMLKEDHWCWAPLIAYGLVDKRGVEDLILPKGQAEIMPSLGYGKYAGIVSAPLRAANFQPDVVLVYSNTAQLRSMLMAAKNVEGTLVTSQFDPIDSCVYSIVPVLLTGQYRITLPDPGEYQRAMAGEDEIIFSIPVDKIATLVSELKRSDERQRGHTHIDLEMRPDFPQPEFYRKLFEAWGLDVP
jgi:uncharacterized protein (DUF169 family)